MVPRSPGPLWKLPPMFGQITEFGFFEKINFLCFWGLKKVFGLRKPTFGGVIILKLFDLSFGFGATGGKIANFWHIQPWKSPKL